MSQEIRIEQAERATARAHWAHISAEERCHIVASHYARLASLAADLRKAVELYRVQPSETSAYLVAHIYQIIERDHAHTFGVLPAWSQIKEGTSSTLLFPAL